MSYLDHSREVASVRQFQDDVEFVVLDERSQILDHVRVIQLLLDKKRDLHFYTSDKPKQKKRVVGGIRYEAHSCGCSLLPWVLNLAFSEQK